MIDYLKGFYKKSDFPIFDKPIVLFLGRSNVGKSSLINALLGKRLAKTSSVPGKTVAIHQFIYNEIYLIDLPGYGYAKRDFKSIDNFSKLSEDFLMYSKKYNPLCLLLIDAKVGFTKDDINAFNYLKKQNFNYLIVLTKTDKCNQSLFYKIRKYLNDNNLSYLETTTLKNKGIDKLKDEVFKITEVKNNE